jgi:hypothetical protein
MARAKTCQGSFVRKSATVNASKTRMIFFQGQWEQKPWLGCLTESLSGKGQKYLSARIPAPGGDQ